MCEEKDSFVLLSLTYPSLSDDRDATKAGKKIGGRVGVTRERDRPVN